MEEEQQLVLLTPLVCLAVRPDCHLCAMVRTVWFWNFSLMVCCSSLSVFWSTLAVASSIHRSYEVGENTASSTGVVIRSSEFVGGPSLHSTLTTSGTKSSLWPCWPAGELVKTHLMLSRRTCDKLKCWRTCQTYFPRIDHANVGFIYSFLKIYIYIQYT